MADTPVERPGDLSATSLTRRRLLINAGVFAGGVMLAGPLAADALIYSLRRISDPKQGLFGTAGLASIDPNKIDKVDDRTVRLNLKQADSTIGDQLGQYYNGIVPVGYTRAGEQIGTGPYKVKSFTKGQQSVHERNSSYWRSGLP